MVWLEWIKYISWFYYGYSALLVNQWSGVTDISCNGTVPLSDTMSSELKPVCISTGEQVLANYSIDQVTYTVCPKK